MHVYGTYLTRKSRYDIVSSCDNFLVDTFMYVLDIPSESLVVMTSSFIVDYPIQKSNA